MMISILVETQMRAGTHYFLDALIQTYNGKVLKIANDKFEFVDRTIINKGLYESYERKYSNEFENRLIFHIHYFHHLPEDYRCNNAQKIHLIGYPFDSFYSDGLIFSSESNYIGPSIKNKKNNNYRLKKGSKEWKFLEPYMIKNAQWLNDLSKKKNAMIVRYEDFFIRYEETIKKIEKNCGRFIKKFPAPILNSTRIYWTNEYHKKIDKTAFDELKSLFYCSIKYFYPEKLPLLYKK